jgi:hypothetical protein
MYIMPGIIGVIRNGAELSPSSVSVKFLVGIEDVLDPDDIAIYRALAGGVTTLNVLHGSSNSIGGKCQVIKARWGKDAAGLKFVGAKPGIKFALGENPKRRGQEPAPGAAATRRHPATWASKRHPRGVPQPSNIRQISRERPADQARI